MPILWSSEVNKTILEQVKVAKKDCDYMLQLFLEIKKFCKQSKF